MAATTDPITPEALAKELAHMANTGFGIEMDALANALASEHPTLLGQIAKAIGLGVMRRTLGTSWGPYDQTCFGPGEANRPDFREPKYLVRGECSSVHGIHPLSGHPVTPRPSHPTHDGRLECDTVIGAELMARQPLI